MASVTMLACDIEEFIKGNSKFDFIVGVPRGGLILAVYLSHELDIPMVSYDDFLKVNPALRFTNALICEDVVDTGKKAKELKEHMHDNDKIVALVVKDHTPEDLLPDFYAATARDYVRFEWE
jgi:adenine/guanine phosphoribosyltransferase-like PRPP-binding protein